MQPCKVCNTPAEHIFSLDNSKGKIVETKIYGEDYERPFYQCPHCDLVFSTGFDNLTDEDFTLCQPKGSTNNLDMVINRGIRETYMVAAFLELLGMSNRSRILVFGCGAGLSVNLMLQAGMDVYASDLSVQFKDSLKLFNPELFKPELLPEMYKRFVLPEDNQKFHMITLTEVFEHFLDPVAEVGSLLDRIVPGGAIVGTTGWTDKVKGDLRDWWYLSGTVSHMTFLSSKSFRHILEQHGCTGMLFPHSHRLMQAGSMSKEQCVFLIQKPK